MAESIPESTPTTPANGASAPEAPKPAPQARKPAKAPKPAPQARKPAKLIHIDTGKPDEWKRLHSALPKKPGDPGWDYRMEQDVPDDFILNLVDPGVRLDHFALSVYETEHGWVYIDGKTRVRVTPEANKERKKVGLPPIVWTVAVYDVADDPTIEIKTRLAANNRMESKITTVAQDVSDAMAQDLSEEWICSHVGLQGRPLNAQKINMLCGLLDIKGEVGVRVRKAVDEGTIALKAGLEMTKLDESKVESALNRVEAASKVGQRVTAAQITRTANPNKIATKKEQNQFALNVQSAGLDGKHGKAALAGFMAGMDLGRGLASLDQTAGRLARAAKGEEVKIDYKPYQNDGKTK